jgi:hypothetical protein
VKHVPGVVVGSSEKCHVARDLLCGIIERGLDPGRLRLFIIDGSKALRKAISELFGSPDPVQRCRTHKLRNVTERLPAVCAAARAGSAAGGMPPWYCAGAQLPFLSARRGSAALWGTGIFGCSSRR